MLVETHVDPVSKAIWFIESHYAKECSLEAVAGASDVSRFHLSRAFGDATGLSVSQYVRGRRLTEAARALAAGAPDILSIALDAGYGSHEAFTRAFRDQFGTTPDAVRAQRSLTGLALIETIRRDHTMNSPIEQPKIEQGRSLLVAGIAERITYETAPRIPLLWQRFTPHIGNLSDEVAGYTYGVKFNAADEGFDYLAGVEVHSLDSLPNELRGVRIPAQKYAVYVHRGHISTIRATMHAIWTSAIPKAGFEVADAIEFERYGPDFDPSTGNGNVDIFIPIK